MLQYGPAPPPACVCRKKNPDEYPEIYGRHYYKSRIFPSTERGKLASDAQLQWPLGEVDAPPCPLPFPVSTRVPAADPIVAVEETAPPLKRLSESSALPPPPPPTVVELLRASLAVAWGSAPRQQKFGNDGVSGGGGGAAVFAKTNFRRVSTMVLSTPYTVFCLR